MVLNGENERGWRIAAGLSNPSSVDTIPGSATRVGGAADCQAYLRTTGTSYLETLRVAAVQGPNLFREIYNLVRQRYQADRASHHVSGKAHRLDRKALPKA